MVDSYNASSIGFFNTVYSYAAENPEVAGLATVAVAAKAFAVSYALRKWREIKAANDVLRKLCGDDLTKSQLRILRRGLGQSIKDFTFVDGVCNETCAAGSREAIRNGCAAVRRGEPLPVLLPAADGAAESAQFSAEKVYRPARLELLASFLMGVGLLLASGGSAATASSITPAFSANPQLNRILDKAGAL